MTIFADLEKHFRTKLSHSTTFTWQELENTSEGFCKILLVVNESVFATKVKNKKTGFKILANQVLKHFNVEKVKKIQNPEKPNINLTEIELAELACHAVCWNQVGTVLDFIRDGFKKVECAIGRVVGPNWAKLG